jgi:hypothetical protein
MLVVDVLILLAPVITFYRFLELTGIWSIAIWPASLMPIGECLGCALVFRALRNGTYHQMGATRSAADARRGTSENLSSGDNSDATTIAPAEMRRMQLMHEKSKEIGKRGSDLAARLPRSSQPPLFFDLHRGWLR